MVSIESVKSAIEEQRGHILILMQEGDSDAGFHPNMDWADEMFDAYQVLGIALIHLDKAQTHG